MSGGRQGFEPSVRRWHRNLPNVGASKACCQELFVLTPGHALFLYFDKPMSYWVLRQSASGASNYSLEVKYWD